MNKIPHRLILLAATSLLGCAGPGARKTAAVAFPIPASGLTMPARIRAVSLEPLKPLEPLLCPIYAGDDRPDYDADSVACVVKWMQEAQDYLARGGMPTKYTDQRNFENYRRLARERMARLATWLDRVAWEPRRLPPKAAAVAPAPVPAGASSQEHYLSGVIFFQKGDYAQARQEWLLSKQLDPSNKDAQAALEHVKKYLTADAGTPPR